MGMLTGIEDGFGKGFGARVTEKGLLNVSAGAHGVDTTPYVVNPPPAGSVQLAAERAGRGNIQIKNLDANNPIYIRLGTTEPTNLDYPVGPGEEFTLPGNVTYEGVIKAISANAPVSVVVLEYY